MSPESTKKILADRERLRERCRNYRRQVKQLQRACDLRTALLRRETARVIELLHQLNDANRRAQEREAGLR